MEPAAGVRLYRTHLLAAEPCAPGLRVLAELDVGFRHQVRVHLASIGLPILGDALYGSGGGPLRLHACRLEFPHPASGLAVTVEG